MLLLQISLPTYALAAQVQTLPSQQIPETPRSAPLFRRQLPESPGLRLQLPTAQGNTREIPLPRVFRGCWSGFVDSLDSIRPLNPDLGRLIWLTKTYTLCYKQAGYKGKWQLTFAKGAVAAGREVSDQRQAIKVDSVTGPDRAELTAYLHFRTQGFVGFRGVARPSTLDELTHLHCEAHPAQNLMFVRAEVFVETNGEPYAEVTWHANFFRTGEQAQRN
jgi:hypothetical protein